MSCELHRLYTFNNSLWKLLSGKHCPSVLAHTGFYYSGSQAIIICYKCLCNIDCSELSDSASIKHEQISPTCLLVIGSPPDNVSLVNPEEVMRKFSADTSLLDTSDTYSCVQTISVSFDSSTVELSSFKTAYSIFVQAYSRSQKRGVFMDVNSELTAVDRNSPDFDRLR